MDGTVIKMRCVLVFNDCNRLPEKVREAVGQIPGADRLQFFSRKANVNFIGLCFCPKKQQVVDALEVAVGFATAKFAARIRQSIRSVANQAAVINESRVQRFPQKGFDGKTPDGLDVHACRRDERFCLSETPNPLKTSLIALDTLPSSVS